MSASPSANSITGQSAELTHARQRIRPQAHTQPQSGGRQSQPNHASGNAQHHAFDNCLSQQRRRPCTQRKPHRDLSSPADRPHQQQGRQVRASNQQHNDHGQKQRPQD